jgi:Holin of 3TMs, for gene-transfer release
MIPIGEILNIGGKILDRVLPDPDKKEAAKIELAKLAMSGDMAKLQADIEAYKVEQENVSARWTADMNSDSWLSKNIRPLTMIFILSAYLLLAIGDGADWFDVADNFVELLGQWGMLVMSAYFGGRTLEKIIEAKSRTGTDKK